MKKTKLLLLSIVFLANLSFAQEWMTSLDVAKRLALTQDKMIFMMWEEATYYPLPVKITDENGKVYFVENLFENEAVNGIIWDHFVPVLISESQYDEMYSEIKGKRKQSYIEKFNDDTIKVLDPAGNILNVSFSDDPYLDLTDFISKYALNTSYLKSELRNYLKEKEFYSQYYLASKYMDYAILSNKIIRPKLLDLSRVYLNEAISYLENNDVDDESTLSQRSELLEMVPFLIDGRARKVLRQLNRIEKTEIAEANKTVIAYLYYTSYLLLNDAEAVAEWEDGVGILDKRKAQLIGNINRY